MREMKLRISIPWVLAGCLALAAGLHAQQQPSDSAGQSAPEKPATQDKTDKGQKPAQAAPQSNANAFPEDTSKVPVMPDGHPGPAPDVAAPEPAPRADLPAQDRDPARSPDNAEPATTASGSESSSVVPGLDNAMPQPDNDTKAKKQAPEYHETADDDINVGKYYLERKDWRAALSRFQSAMVLAPENAEVYWGLAESEHHLGNFAAARANYLKVMEYDPDSRHYKDAEKALKEPEIAKAQNSASGPSQ
jgi:tetratricopeptide (TPR) repeat protein